MIEQLKWDSDFFGWKTGIIKADKQINIGWELTEAEKNHYHLVYVFGDHNLNIDNDILNNFDGVLVDKKVTFEIELSSDINQNAGNVVEYNQNKPDETLFQLAFESGSYSRFKLDKHFQNNEFHRMYESWIIQSVNKLIADCVFVTYEGEKITGMATLKIDNQTAHIGLIAILSGYQGKGFGRELIDFCKVTAVQKQCKKLIVPTQLANNKACEFYKACGFKILSIVNIYHFWL